MESALSVLIMFCWLAVESVPSLCIVAVLFDMATGGNIPLQGPTVMQVTSKLGMPVLMLGQMFAFQSVSFLIGPPISGYILGTDPARQMDNFKWAIIFNGGLLVIATVFAIVARMIQSRKWKKKV